MNDTPLDIQIYQNVHDSAMIPKPNTVEYPESLISQLVVHHRTRLVPYSRIIFLSIQAVVHTSNDDRCCPLMTISDDL